jgi:non-ribosomal peptide synthetase component F
LLYLCGEPVYRRDFELYKRHFSADCVFANGMGSTECLTHRWYLMNKESRVSDTSVPVGYPLEDVEVLLLDDEGRSVPFDELGEISVKSRYLSPGYWRKPELTRASFAPTRAADRSGLSVPGISACSVRTAASFTRAERTFR